MFHVSSNHLVQREGTSDIDVHDKELLRVAAHDFIAEVVKTASSAQRLIFTQVPVKIDKVCQYEYKKRSVEGR